MGELEFDLDLEDGHDDEGGGGGGGGGGDAARDADDDVTGGNDADDDDDDDDDGDDDWLDGGNGSVASAPTSGGGGGSGVARGDEQHENSTTEHVSGELGGDEGNGEGAGSSGPNRSGKFVPNFLVVARFLGSIQPERTRRFSDLCKRADARMGMAVHDAGDGNSVDDSVASSDMVDFVS
jgi:hypothetical protein